MIGRMKSLKWLEFQDCPITDNALASVTGLTNLELFDLYGTNVSGDGLKYSFKDLPKLSGVRIFSVIGNILNSADSMNSGKLKNSNCLAPA